MYPKSDSEDLGGECWTAQGQHGSACAYLDANCDQD